VSLFLEQKQTQPVSAGDVLAITVSTPVTGALGYNIYVGTATGAGKLEVPGNTQGNRYILTFREQAHKA